MGIKINGSLRVLRSVLEMFSGWWALYFRERLMGLCAGERKQMLLLPNGNAYEKVRYVKA